MHPVKVNSNLLFTIYITVITVIKFYLPHSTITYNNTINLWNKVNYIHTQSILALPGIVCMPDKTHYLN